ncbi:GNAT family N-acetyltransferase [Octadecabacter sp. 1_MG-2023]|uniref:GNAT family N-acetyltransferase n=1 Tax=unclassified Octadecabacter TaxID=196158 RepID=UPI001C0A3E0B|nr:GNAT family N-acetyltransferase [Octadecabacter sp. 1_MG-2023]MBU2991808.1 GNAT family N-acetyltransferase [Octadecabacter sp. B2R22]MDO6735781.1 GNAT family N-acetyltransferase [Octadecabacter sp. 1_MG-2023]
MTPEGLAQTHDAAFVGKGWPIADFATYLNDPKILVSGDDICFAVFRLAGPEAEVLTLATHPDEQGKGRAGVMLQKALVTLTDMQVEEVFLDVAEDNQAACALYDHTGFAPFARRDAYYASGAAAICMKVALYPTSRG